MIRVFLVDDHEIVRRGLTELFDAEPDMTVVGQAGSAADALETIHTGEVDVAVIDVRLADGNGIDLCRELRKRFPETACLILTSFADDDALLEAARAGAAGFVLKRVVGHDLVANVRTAAAGGSLMDSDHVARLVKHARVAGADPLAELSPQEHTVLDLIGEGLTNKQIGERMYLSDKTVKNYVSHLLTKLNLQRRAQLAALAAGMPND